jgi:hypothetical protein
MNGQEGTARHREPAPLEVDIWHEVVIELLPSSFAVFVDGTFIGEYAFLPGLPRESPLGLVAVDQAFLLDDLRVERLGEQREASEPDAEEPTPPAVPPTASVRPDRDLTDSRIAVVGVEADDAVIAGALAGFVTNAFVNYRVGRIVDRDSVERIIEEHQFQASAITDEDDYLQMCSDAVEPLAP